MKKYILSFSIGALISFLSISGTSYALVLGGGSYVNPVIENASPAVSRPINFGSINQLQTQTTQADQFIAHLITPTGTIDVQRFIDQRTLTVCYYSEVKDSSLPNGYEILSNCVPIPQNAL